METVFLPFPQRMQANIVVNYIIVDPLFLALYIIIILFSVILHEVMHGLVALKFGDHTAERAGRLTLNPLPHIDPIGTIILPALILIPPLLTGASPGPFLAWAKPVPVSPLNFSNIRKGELFVSAAGIAANFALAVAAAAIYHILNAFPQTPLVILRLLVAAVSINLFLGVFNLFPIPPLDGSKILLSQLPLKMAREFQKLEQYGFLILIFLIFIFPAPLFLILRFFVNLFSSILGF